MADSFCACHVGAGRSVQIRSEPHRATMALDYLGQRICCGRMARRFGPVLMVRGQFWHLQQNLWLSGRDHRLHDWIWISIIVVLVGAKLNAEMEHQTALESTAGQPKPLGRRGARMADTVGAAQS